MFPGDGGVFQAFFILSFRSKIIAWCKTTWNASTAGVPYGSTSTGTTKQTSAISFMAPPSKPEKPMIWVPFSWASFMALTRFCDQGPALPEPEPPWTEKPTKISRSVSQGLSWPEKTLPQPSSLVQALARGILSTREMVLKPSRALCLGMTVLARSAAKCVAVEAEPPQPMVKTAPPVCQQSKSRSTACRYSAAFLKSSEIWEMREKYFLELNGSMDIFNLYYHQKRQCQLGDFYRNQMLYSGNDCCNRSNGFYRPKIGSVIGKGIQTE